VVEIPGVRLVGKNLPDGDHQYRRKNGKAPQTFSLYWAVDVVMPNRCIWVLVMSYVVDLVLLEELRRDDPGSFRDNVIRPLAVANVLAPATAQGSQRAIQCQVNSDTPLLVVHYSIRLVRSDKLIGTDPN